MKFAALTMVVLCLVGCGKTTLDSFPTGPAIESPEEDQITELRLTAIRDGKFVKPHRSSGPTTYFYAELVANEKKYPISSSKGLRVEQYSKGQGRVTDEQARNTLVMTGEYEWDINGKLTPIPWHAIFCAARRAPLKPVQYPNAKRSLSDVDSPGVDVRGSQFGCGKLSGSFAVWELHETEGKIDRVAIDFTQECEGGEGKPPIYGIIRFNSSFK